MFRLIQYLIFGHVHKWKIIREYRLTGNDSVGARYVLQCEICGDVKKRDLI